VVHHEPKEPCLFLTPNPRTGTMTYSAIHNALIIDANDLQRAAHSIRYAMKRYRTAADVPLGLRKSESGLSDFDHAEKQMLDGLKAIGIDFAAEWGDQLDLTNA